MPSTRTLIDPALQTQLYEEYNRLNSLEICYYGQELVQELVQKSAEFCFALRQTVTSLLVGDQHSYSIRKTKIDEILKSLETILTRLRVSSDIISERKQAIDKQPADQVLAKEDDLKRLQKERDDLVQQVKLKNSFVKFAEQKIADIIWNINAIQTLKH